MREIACCFAAHLRITRSTKGHPIKAVTIDQYITHVADYLVTNEHILSGGELRSRRLTMLLAGYTASDDVGIPLRLRQKIPMTYPIACIMYRLAATMHTGAKRLALRAAVAMAFGLSLRPGEYLVMEEETPLTHQANASDCFFVFNDDEYVCVSVTLTYTLSGAPRPSSSVCLRISRVIRRARADQERLGELRARPQTTFAVSSHCMNTSAPTQGDGKH